jgi:cytochrome c
MMKGLRLHTLTRLAVVAGLAFGLTWAGLLAHRAAGADSTARGEALVKSSDCLSCHAIDHKVVGPAFQSVAQRYAGQPGIVPKLVEKVRKGGSGNWGSVAMTPHPNLSTADLTAMVEWVLSLRPAASAKKAPAARPPPKTYTYTVNGRRITLDFPVFTTDHHVTAAIFSGWERFDSYCYRCHGEDAIGVELAPDLRESLRGGMTREQFIATAMAGRPGKGMPSWAGFFSPTEILEVYEYVKARSVGLVAPGRPGGE